MASFDVERFATRSPELLERLLQSGGTYADVFYEHTVTHQHDLRQRLLGRRLGPPQRRARTHTLHGTGLRVVDGPAQGFAAVDGWNVPAQHQAARRAAAALETPPSGLRPAPLSATTPHALPDAPPGVACDALLVAAADAAFALDAEVRHVRATCQDRLRRVSVATSEGRLAAWAQPLIALRVEVMLATDDCRITTHAVAGGSTLLDVRDAELTAREAVHRARMLARARSLPTGRVPVVLAPGWGGVWLHEAVGHLLEADVVERGPFAGCTGQRVAAPRVTLVDDGTLAGGRATAPYDDEGTPAQRTPLIDGGVLTGVLTDRRHRPGGTPLTGNARRQDYRHPPLPRMTNLCLLPDPAGLTDLIGSVQTGLYVEMLGGGRVWPARRMFAFDVLAGRRIERGRLTHPAAGFRVMGRLPDALQHLTLGAVSRLDTARGLCTKHQQTVPVSVGMPAVRLDGLTVTPR